MKKEEPQVGDVVGEHDSAQLGVVSVKAEPHQEVVSCHGCNRTKGASLNYFCDEVVQWAFPSGRGHWCKDCHNC